MREPIKWICLFAFLCTNVRAVVSVFPFLYRESIGLFQITLNVQQHYPLSKQLSSLEIYFLQIGSIIHVSTFTHVRFKCKKFSTQEPLNCFQSDKFVPRFFVKLMIDSCWMKLWESSSQILYMFVLFFTIASNIPSIIRVVLPKLITRRWRSQDMNYG